MLPHGLIPHLELQCFVALMPCLPWRMCFKKPNHLIAPYPLNKHRYFSNSYIYVVEPKLGPRFGFSLSQNLVQGCVKTWSMTFLFPYFIVLFAYLKTQIVCRGCENILGAVCQGVKKGFSGNGPCFVPIQSHQTLQK